MVKRIPKLSPEELQFIKAQYNNDTQYDVSFGFSHIQQAWYLAEGSRSKMHRILELLATHRISFEFIDQSYALKQVIDSVQVVTC